MGEGVSTDKIKTGPIVPKDSPSQRKRWLPVWATRYDSGRRNIAKALVGGGMALAAGGFGLGSRIGSGFFTRSDTIESASEPQRTQEIIEIDSEAQRLGELFRTTYSQIEGVRAKAEELGIFLPEELAPDIMSRIEQNDSERVETEVRVFKRQNSDEIDEIAIQQTLFPTDPNSLVQGVEYSLERYIINTDTGQFVWLLNHRDPTSSGNDIWLSYPYSPTVQRNGNDMSTHPLDRGYFETFVYLVEAEILDIRRLVQA